MTRLSSVLLLAAVAGGCDTSTSDADSVATIDGQVTLALPPAEPAEPATPARAPQRAAPAPAPAPKKEPPAAAAPADAVIANAADATLVEAPPPLAIGRLAPYIRGAGFACDEVVASNQLRGADGARIGIYKFDCGAGGSYQGTIKRNHLYFRPWAGTPGEG